MTHPNIDVRPHILDLFLYAGDGVSFRLVCLNNDGDAISLTGSIAAQIRLQPNSTDDAIVDFSVNLDNASDGIIVLSLTGEQTRILSDNPSHGYRKFTGVWDIQWTPPDTYPRTLCKGKVECVSDVTR